MFPYHRIVEPAVVGIFTICFPMVVQPGNSRFQEALSPDHSMVAYVNAEDGDSEIYIERVSGTEQRRLTSNDFYDNDPSWSPDGNHIAFASDRTGNWQIHRMDLDGGNVTQLTSQESGCVRPKYGSQGQLAYLIPRGRKFKLKLFDLVVSQGENLKQLEHQIPIYSFAWNPDGDLIGCATDGRFILHNLRAGTTTIVELNNTDERLSSYGVFDCQWSTEQEGFIGRLRFLGGVPEGSEVYADNELFLIRSNGEACFVAE